MDQTNKVHLIRAARISLAMIISFIYIRVTNVSDGVWIMMTGVVVLFDNSTVGGALIKGYYRMIGTITAAVFSILVVIAFADSTIMNLIAVVLGVFAAAYYFMDTKKAYIGIMIAFTPAIMLLSNHNLTIIFIRPLNIMVGIIIAYLVQRFFYPEYAKNLVLNPLIDLISKAQILLQSAIEVGLDKDSHLKREKMEINVISNINKAIRLIEEANGELSNVPDYGMVCDALIIRLRKTFKYIAVFSHQVEDKIIPKTKDLQLVIEKLISVLDMIQSSLEKSLHGHNELINSKEMLEALKNIEEKYFAKCSNEQILILKMITKELLEIDQLMLKLLKIRQSNKMC